MHHLLHPPAYLLVITPFVLPPSAIGAAVWDLVNLIGLAAGVLLIVRERRARPAGWQLLIFFVLLAVWPPLQSALLGHIIIALPVCSLVLLLSCLLSVDSQHEATASGWKMSSRSS